MDYVKDILPFVSKMNSNVSNIHLSALETHKTDNHSFI